MRFLARTSFLVAAFLACVPALLAQNTNYTWNDTGTGNWNQASNWTPNGGTPSGVPNSSTTAQISNGGTARVTDTQAVGSTYIALTGSQGGTLRVAPGTNSNLTVYGQLDIRSGGQVIVGSQSGDGGTLTVTNNTQVNGGTLTVDWQMNSNSSFSRTSINDGGLLQGEGSIYGNVVVGAGGTISPGLRGLALTNYGNLVFTTGGTYTWNLKGDSTALNRAGKDYDQINVRTATPGNGKLDLDALTVNHKFNINVNIESGGTFNPNTTHTWQIIQTDNGFKMPVDFTGQFKDLFNVTVTGSTIPSSQFAISQSGNNVVLTYTPVPEPATVLAFGVGMLGLVRLRRRYSRTSPLAHSMHATESADAAV